MAGILLQHCCLMWDVRNKMLVHVRLRLMCVLRMAGHHNLCWTTGGGSILRWMWLGA